MRSVPGASHSEGPPATPPTLQVRVQAGARVQAVADELRKHGLTLQNYASIREQTIGGFTQVPPGLRQWWGGVGWGVGLCPCFHSWHRPLRSAAASARPVQRASLPRVATAPHLPLGARAGVCARHRRHHPSSGRAGGVHEARHPRPGHHRAQQGKRGRRRQPQGGRLRASAALPCPAACWRVCSGPHPHPIPHPYPPAHHACPCPSPPLRPRTPSCLTWRAWAWAAWAWWQR